MEEKKYEAIVEAILFTMGESVELERIAKTLELDTERTKKIIEHLMQRYEDDGVGVKIMELDGSYQMCTKGEMYEYLVKIAKQPKKHVLTDVLLETLSIIAYKQPVTKADIEKIRGVKSDHAINKLIEYDLVKEQIRIANNEVLHLKQEELFQRGHAIECRICAEDTENNFMPSPGIIKQLTEPNGIGVRIDSYVYEGYEIPVFYDPMIGKLIVWATTRQYAIERMRRVLYEYKITGLKTNLSYLKRIMHTPDFVKGEYNTLFIEKNSRMLLRGNGNNEEIENMAMIASYIDYLMNLEENKSPQLSDARPISRWREFGLQKGVLRI